MTDPTVYSTVHAAKCEVGLCFFSPHLQTTFSSSSLLTNFPHFFPTSSCLAIYFSPPPSFYSSHTQLLTDKMGGQRGSQVLGGHGTGLITSFKSTTLTQTLSQGLKIRIVQRQTCYDSWVKVLQFYCCHHCFPRQNILKGKPILDRDYVAKKK